MSGRADGDRQRDSDPLQALRRGSAFLIAQAGGPWLSAPWPDGRQGYLRARVLGNWLREMDSLLHGLLDEVVSATDRRLDAKSRSTAARWRRLPLVAARDGRDRRRLLGLDRSRLSFCHHGGRVRDTDHPAVSWMTAGWPVTGSAELRRFAVGTRLELDGRDLIDTCRFYDRLAMLLTDRR